MALPRRWLVPLGLAALGSFLIAWSVAPGDGWAWSLVAWTPLTVLAAWAGARWPQDRWVVRRAMIAAFVIATGRWLWLEQWIREVSEAGWPALALAMAMFDAIFVWAVARTERLPGRARVPLAARAGVLLVASEWLRGRVFLEGYPWFMPGQPMIEWPLLAQAADVVGASGMGLVPGMVAGALADAWLARCGVVPAAARWRRGALATVCVLMACAAYGWARMRELDAQAAARSIHLLAIQPNVPQSNKDAPDRRTQDTLMADLLQRTRAAVQAERRAGRRVDLVVWPETVIPGFGLEPDAILMQRERGLWPADRYVAPVEALAAEGPPILLGSAAFEGLAVSEAERRYTWKRHFNSGYLVRGPGDHDRVDKILLTPFGETMPYISRWKWLERQLLDLGARGMSFDLQAGESPRLLQVETPDGSVRLGVPICFEDTVSRASRAIATCQGGAEAMVNLSNDGWFGDFDPGRVHHEQAARWRSVELRRPLVRVANTGCSAAFDACGRRIAGPLAARSTGSMRVEVPLAPVWSLFARVGDVASWTMTVLGLMLVAGRMPRGGLVATAIAAMALVPLACDAPPKGRLPTWSSRDQSVTPDGSATLSDGRPVRAALPVSASGDDRTNAQTLLDEASRSPDPMIRAIAIEAMEPDPALLEPAVRRGLGDPNPGVRFVAAMVGSKAGLEGLAPLVEPLRMDANESVQASAILALHRCGRKVDLAPLARMIFSPSAEVRGNAAMVLGELGNRTALPMLSEALLTPMPRALPAQVRVVDLQIGEAMVKLGDTAQLEPIHAALFSRSDQGECIGLACQIVGSLRDQSAIPMLQRLIDAGGSDTRPTEIRLVAAVAVMQILRPGPSSLVELGVLGSQDARPEVRGIAARLLGSYQTPESIAALGRLLRDRDPAVQVAAAAAVLRQGGPRQAQR
jgi:apolipoprotein N-acyltransferase